MFLYALRRDAVSDPTLSDGLVTSMDVTSCAGALRRAPEGQVLSGDFECFRRWEACAGDGHPARSRTTLNGIAQYTFRCSRLSCQRYSLLASMPHTACCQADHQVVIADYTEVSGVGQSEPRHVAQNGIHRTKAPAVIKTGRPAQGMPTVVRLATTGIAAQLT